MSKSEYLKWRDLVGDFILEFANVENEVFGIFEDFGSDEDIIRAKGVQFKGRVAEAIRLIDIVETDQSVSRPIKRALNELLLLAEEVRNVVAHNPIQLSLDGVFAGTNEHEIRSFRRYEKVITFEQLQESYSELQKWRDQLFGATYRLRVKTSWARAKDK